MPRVVKRGKVWYAEYFDRSKGYTTRVSLGTDDRVEAERGLGELLTKANDPVKARLSMINVDELVAKYYVEVGKTLPSRYVYKATLAHVVEDLPGKSVEWFDRKNQEGFVSGLREKGLADGTIHRMMGVISRSLTWAYQNRMIREKPYVITVNSAKTRERTLSDDEAGALIKAAESENERRFVLLALTTGSRPQALMDAHKSQFDRDNKLIRLNPDGREQNKKKHRPIIPMTEAVYIASESWQDGPIFVVQADHKTQMKSARYVWDSLHKKAGLPADVTAYTIRHTVATELRKQGVPEWDISGYLGHKGPGSATTARYAHWRPGFMRSAADAMDRYWGKLTNGSTTDLDAGRGEEEPPTDTPRPGILEGIRLQA